MFVVSLGICVGICNVAAKLRGLPVFMAGHAGAGLGVPPGALYRIML